jgi:hypothetical protein
MSCGHTCATPLFPGDSTEPAGGQTGVGCHCVRSLSKADIPRTGGTSGHPLDRSPELSLFPAGESLGRVRGRSQSAGGMSVPGYSHRLGSQSRRRSKPRLRSSIFTTSTHRTALSGARRPMRDSVRRPGPRCERGPSVAQLRCGAGWTRTTDPTDHESAKAQAVYQQEEVGSAA